MSALGSALLYLLAVERRRVRAAGVDRRRPRRDGRVGRRDRGRPRGRRAPRGAVRSHRHEAPRPDGRLPGHPAGLGAGHRARARRGEPHARAPRLPRQRASPATSCSSRCCCGSPPSLAASSASRSRSPRSRACAAARSARGRPRPRSRSPASTSRSTTTRRLLAAHRVDDAPHARGALVRGAAVVLPVALAVGLVVYRVAPLPRPDPPPETIVDAYKPVDEKPKRELDLRALRALVLSGLGGAVFIYFVGRWLVRSKKGERGAIETPEPLRGALERIREPPRRRRRAVRATPAGAGGSCAPISTCCAAADRAGFARRPDETAGEFAAAAGGAARAARDRDRRLRAGALRPVRSDRRGRAAGRARRRGRARAPRAAPAGAAGPGRPRRRLLAGGRFSRTPSFVISILLIVPSGSSYSAVTRRSNQLGPARGASRPPRFASGLASGRRARLPATAVQKLHKRNGGGTC